MKNNKTAVRITKSLRVRAENIDMTLEALDLTEMEHILLHAV